MEDISVFCLSIKQSQLNNEINSNFNKICRFYLAFKNDFPKLWQMYRSSKLPCKIRWEQIPPNTWALSAYLNTLFLSCTDSAVSSVARCCRRRGWPLCVQALSKAEYLFLFSQLILNNKLMTEPLWHLKKCSLHLISWEKVSWLHFKTYQQLIDNN